MKRFLSLLLLAISILGTWYFASPWLAMNGIVQAARDGDEEALARRIDFERLRTESRAGIDRSIGERTRDGGVLDRIGGAIAGGVAGFVVDNALTPRGIVNLVTVGSLAAPMVPERFRGQDLEWDVERHGLDRFDGVSTWEDGSAGPTLEFERDGIGWDLTGIALAE